jgi:acyl-CoA thioester hydrolase
VAAKSIEIEVQPAFYDVDALQIVWHGNYVKYFELARSALMESIGYNYFEMRESGFVWPIVELQVKYVKPSMLQQKLIVKAEIVEFECRLKIRYRITDKLSGVRLTEGSTTQVAVDAKTNEMLFVCPKALTDKFDSA